MYRYVAYVGLSDKYTTARVSRIPGDVKQTKKPLSITGYVYALMYLQIISHLGESLYNNDTVNHLAPSNIDRYGNVKLVAVENRIHVCCWTYVSALVNVAVTVRQYMILVSVSARPLSVRHHFVHLQPVQ